MHKKNIEKAKKILALAKQGEGGERENAERQLIAFLNKHKLTLDDIENESAEINAFHIYYANKFEKMLLLQIIDMTFNEFSSEVYVNTKIRKPHLLIKATKAQETQIRLYFEVLRNKLDQELQHTVYAFIRANEISFDHEPLDINKLTPEQIKNRAKVAGMAMMMEKTNVLKQISQES